jgi:hypothetical protein
MKAKEFVSEKWSQKYKRSINCSHPKGFSQKAHCAGKKKHNESVEMEMTCPHCGMCETHCDRKNLDEACWKGYHKEGNKELFGKTVPNCVKNESERAKKELDRIMGPRPVQPKDEPDNSKPVTEKTSPEIFNRPNNAPIFSTKPKKIGNYIFDASEFEGSMVYGKDAKGLIVRAYDPKNMDVIGSASFVLVRKKGKNGDSWLESDDTKVKEKYRGKGIATAMYQYAKDLGNDIKPSPYKSNAGGEMWKAWGRDVFEEEQHSCPHCGGEMVSEELMNEKKDACYYKVKSRYKVWPSAYASGALVKCRKSGADSWGNGGKKNESSILEGLERADENLHQWFKEKWVRFGPDGKIRGACARGSNKEGKPKCLPQSKAHNLGKKGRASAAQRKRREDPNPERSGKAINVATKKVKETKGLPFPGTYEQEYNMFKKKGPERITAMTY